MSEKKCCSAFDEQACQFITGESSVTRIKWKLRATQRRESQRGSKYPRSTLIRETPEPKNVKEEQGPIGSQVRKRQLRVACLKMEVTPFQAMHQARDSAEKLDDIGSVE